MKFCVIDGREEEQRVQPDRSRGIKFQRARHCICPWNPGKVSDGLWSHFTGRHKCPTFIAFISRITNVLIYHQGGKIKMEKKIFWKWKSLFVGGERSGCVKRKTETAGVGFVSALQQQQDVNLFLQQSHLMAAFSSEGKSHQDWERLGSLCPRYGQKRDKSVFNFHSNPSQKKIGLRLGCKYASWKGKTYLFHVAGKRDGIRKGQNSKIRNQYPASK